MHVVESSQKKPAYAAENLPQDIEELGGKLLEKFGLSQSSINDFRDNSWRDKLLSTMPDKREEILLMSQFARNPEIINLVLRVFHESLGGKMTQKVAKTAAGKTTPIPEGPSDASSTCPYCGRTYRYAKSLAKHKDTCPKKPKSV
jgi:hypothetical protein